MVRVGSSEQVVRHVGPDVGVTGVGPVGVGGDARDARHERLLVQNTPRVRVALHIVVTAGPRPIGVPAATRRRVARVDRGALRALSRGGTPGVVVKGPSVLGNVPELVAELLGRNDGCQGGNNGKGLHLDYQLLFRNLSG